MIKELMSFILLSSIIGIEFLITPTVDEESSNGLQSSAHLDIDYGTNITCLNPTQVISSGNLFISFESEGEISELSCPMAEALNRMASRLAISRIRRLRGVYSSGSATIV